MNVLNWLHQNLPVYILRNIVLTKVPKNKAKPRTPHIVALETRDGGRTVDSREIANELRSAFFPPTRQADLSDLEGFEYPEPEIMPAITRKEVIAYMLNTT